MTTPLLVLAAGAIFSGFAFYGLFVGEGMEAFWGDSIFILPSNNVIEVAHHAPPLVKTMPLIAGVGGLLLAVLCYYAKPGIPGLAAELLKPVHVLFYNKWFFDEIYDFLFTRPAIAVGRIFWKRVDGGIIDAFGPDGISAATMRVARLAARLQTGYVFHYAFAMLIGVVLLLVWYAHAYGMLQRILAGGA